MLFRWVPFDIAKPLLDRAKYAVLSDYIDMQKENSSSIQESGKLLDQQNDDLGDGDLNDFCVGGDDSNSSDEEMFPEINELAADPIQNDVGRLQLDLRGTRVKYKVYKLCLYSFQQGYKTFVVFGYQGWMRR